jgi:hypothetical protein
MDLLVGRQPARRLGCDTALPQVTLKLCFHICDAKPLDLVQ